MKIIRNSAKCTACDVELESTHRHDFNVHFCDIEPTPAVKWMGAGPNKVLVEDLGKFTWRFAVDGGKEYIRRAGVGFKDTSIYE